MTNLAHITETALLLLAAYLLGCVLGYAIRLVLHAGRGTRQVAPSLAAATTPLTEPRKPRSSAARLAASVEEALPPGPTAPPPVAKSAVVAPPTETTVDVVAKATPNPVTSSRPVKEKSSDSKPAALIQARGGGPDNLKQIKGIGPKIEASLYGLGIFHIDQIAGWNKANVEWVDAQLSFKGRIRRERWVEQALELSAGKAQA